MRVGSGHSARVCSIAFRSLNRWPFLVLIWPCIRSSMTRGFSVGGNFYVILLVTIAVERLFMVGVLNSSSRVRRGVLLFLLSSGVRHNVPRREARSSMGDEEQL
jgi:hypothetical protein